MQFFEFSKHLETLEQTNSRLEMMYQLANLYRDLAEDEIKIASYLMQGSLMPAYLSLEFQLSAKMVVRALAQLYSEYSQEGKHFGLFGEQDITNSIVNVTKLYKKDGDIGQVSLEIVKHWQEKFDNVKDAKQSVKDVYDTLVEIAKEGGSGSQERKLRRLVELLKSSNPVSSKFIARIIVGKLRLGFSAMTILDSLSWAVAKSKVHRTILENAYQKRADVGELAQVYLFLAKESKDDLKFIEKMLEEKYKVVVGIPVVPALCQRLNTTQEIIKKMKLVYAEPKYDGLRVQIHYSRKGFDEGSHVRAFTRNLDEVTHMFPELEKLDDIIKTDSCILDSEAIGYDANTGKLLPFQATITRKRKHDISKTSKDVPICFYVFDVLFSGNSQLIDKNLRERKALLKVLINENRSIKIASFIETSNPIELHKFHEEQLTNGLEGAVMKQVDSKYQSGRKGWSWVKIKEPEGSSGKLKDTLDLVVMGYYYGRGKRSAFGIGAFLVGVLDDKQEIKTIAKIGTGLSDEQFRELKKICDKFVVKEKPIMYEVEKSLIPDIWISPQLVVEIAADEITKSPTHSAKVALRFPRLISFRTDKNWTDATSINELANF